MSEEDIKILEEKIEFWKNDPRIMIQEENYKILQVIENILKERQADKERIKELEEENKELMKLKENHDYSVDVIRENTKLRYDLFNSIPKAKVEEMIKKYKKMSDDFYIKFLEGNRLDKDIHDVGISCDAKVQVLQELLLKDGGE